jgi:hypothetical protein
VPPGSHRIRYTIIALVLTWMALMLFTRPAHGAWSADPVEVHATSALCPAVSAIDDGHCGAIIVWQENTASGGLLKAQHLEANGDVDAADVVIPGTRDLPGGVYFARAGDGLCVLNARVIVLP